jgi:hypothetical protein
MLRRVALVRTGVKEERIASIIRLIKFVELGTALAATSNCSISSQRAAAASAVPSSPILVTLKMEAMRSSETWILAIATRCNIPEDGILRIHRREDLTPYTKLYKVVRVL